MRNTNVILFLRYLIYNFIGFNSFIIRKIIFSFYHKYNKYKFKHKSISLCGRGISVNKFFNNDFKKHSKVYLVNYCAKDLRLNDYLKLVNKDLVLVSNITEDMPNMVLLFLIKICEIIITQPDSLISSGIINPKRKSYKLNLLGVNVRGYRKSKYINIYEKNKEVGGFGSGIYAIYEAAEYAIRNNIKDIYLYGFDFYSGPYNKLSLLREEYNSDKQYFEHMADNHKISKSLDYLVSKYPNLSFKNNTLNNYKFKSENIKRYLYKEEL